MAATATVEIADFEPYRSELTGYCYRMLGSGFEAEDAVQETMIKALRGADELAERCAVRAWLYRIATNVCIDMGRQVQRRARPVDMGPASLADEPLLGELYPESAWITPLPDRVLGADPADIAEQRESVRLAFVTALQHLPGRQRAALDAVPAPTYPRLEADDSDLLERYVDAFERYDIDAFVSLLHDDAVQSMPPYAMWLRGAKNITDFMVQPGPSKCRGSKLLATRANGCPAFGQYKPDPVGGFQPWAIQVVEISGGKISELALFLQPLDPERLFPTFGLPTHLDA
ncbi:MAG: sigma-70 family RNA polymerase sigma factor [Mycobacteriales bacterium]